MKMRRPLIAGNWKMHKTLAEGREIVQGIRGGLKGVTSVDVLICPPAQLLFPMAKAIADSCLKLGAQNAHEAREGAFTGEVSVPMLAETGCTYVLIGHSERRHIFGETGQRLARKVRAVVAEPMQVIYCVGETIDEREAEQTHEVIERQIDEVIDAEVPADRLVLAYEPVWAIGTGRTATPQQAQDVHALIRRKLATIYDSSKADTIRILYGGSVKPANAAQLLAQADIDGALVGGACLVVADFLAIIGAAASVAAEVA